MDITIKHVLVPVDLGPLSEKVLNFARAIASGSQAKVHLLHVLEEPFTTAGPYEFVLPDTAVRRERLHEQAQTRLSAMAEELRLKDVAATAEVCNGAVSDQIVMAAMNYGADLVVMGKRHHRRLPYVPGSGLGEQVSRRVGCPVLTIQDHGGTKMAAA
jgi:nucleotide-binding universal stress UspA family protein